jgi:8-oxo-dGTP pyrophosphatase MutT (NUDIX family)
MAKEISVGAVIYKRGKKIEYLLLHKNASEHYKELWDFPRGNIEGKESQIKTAQREIEEETGLTKIGFDETFKESIRFFYKKEGETIFKEAIYYLAELLEEQDIKLSMEHIGYRWVSYETAMKLLTHENTKQLLEKADKAVKERKEQKRLGEF